MQLKPPVSHTKGIIMNKLIYPLAGALMLGVPLDHGPRALTTPYLNQLRKQRFEAEMKTCKE